MYITLNKTIKEVNGIRYNKNEIMAFVILIVGLTAVYMLTPAGNISGSIVCLSAFLLLSLIQSGYYALASNNEINLKDAVFPTTGDFMEIMKVGIKYFFGMLALIFTSYILPTLVIIGGLALSYFSATEETSLELVITGIALMMLGMVSYFIIAYMFIIPLNVLFLQSLNIKDLFNIKKANEKRLENKKLYNSYFSRLILVNLICYIVGGVIAVIFTICAHEFLSKLPTEIAKENIQIVSSITALICQTLWLPNLHGQFINYKEEEVNTEEQVEE